MAKRRDLSCAEKNGPKSAVTDSSPKHYDTSAINLIQKEPPCKRSLPLTAKNWAEQYRSWGLSVFAVVTGTKKPKCSWKKYQEQPPTSEELEKMFGGGDCNIGIVTGKVSGIVVVDLDTAEAVQYAKDHGFFDNTPCVKTNKGYHLYFLYKDGLRNFQGRADLPGIDLRGDGGCVVAPPSTHESGHQYHWEEGNSPWDIEFAEFPEMLLAKNTTEKRPIADILENGSQEGNRNTNTVRLAGHFAREGLDLAELTSKLMECNQKNYPPLPNEEITKIAESIFEKHQESGAFTRSPTTTTLLIQSMTTPDFTYFTDEVGVPHVHLNTGDHFETIPLESQKIKLFISMICFKQLGIPIKDSVTKEVMSVLLSKAFFEGQKLELSYRIAQHEGAIWIDLGNEQRQAIRITAEGWNILESRDVPILFRRYSHTKALPIPVKGGSLNDLKKTIYVASEDIWILLQVWMPIALIPDIPRPGIILHGLHGAGKSITSNTLRSLIDPSEIPLLATPANHNEFVLQNNNNYLICLDNLQFLKPWMSDALCRAVTGGAFSKRRLYTDNDEIIYKFKRLFIINGISNPAGASDILDRSILIELDRIPQNQRKTERELMSAFSAIAPGVFGEMCTVLSTVLRTKDDFKLPPLPRMADWAKYGYAAAEALGIGGERFLEAYENNIQLQHLEVIDTDPVASTVKALAEQNGEISGTATSIYHKCKNYLDEDERKANSWPKNAGHFSKRLKVASSNLRELGVYVEFIRKAERIITIKYKPQ